MESSTPSSGKAPVAIFITVFIAVFMLVTFTTTIVTFILPEYYAGTARIRVDADKATECEIMKSQSVLEGAINKVNLNVEWGKKYNNGAPLRMTDTLYFLKSRLDIHPERDTQLIDVTVYTKDPNEAAQIANAIVDSYCSRQQTSEPSLKIEIIDKATPSIAPAKPNKQLNMVLGVLAGILLGSIVGGIIAKLASLRMKPQFNPPQTSIPNPSP